MNQKAAILLLFFLGLLNSFSYGQDVSYGIQGGINKTNFSADSIINDYDLNHLTFGGVIEYVGTSIWGFQIEVNYIEKGSGSAFVQNDTMINQELKLKYIEVPMMAKIKLGVEQFYFCGYGGVSLAYGLKVLNNVKLDGQSLDEEVSSFKDFHFTPYEMSLLFGADLNVAIKNTIIYIDARYSKGFTSLFETKQGFYSNKGTQIKAGIKYRF